MTIKHLYPNTRPTLDLKFAKDKTLDPRITFSRASSGTYVDENGVIQSAASGEARFDHDPVTNESLGLLVEESRTNLVTYSEYFSQWLTNTSTITPNTTSAPDGTITADTLEFLDASGASNGVYQEVVGLTVGQTYTFSFWARATSSKTIRARVYSSSNEEVFNVTTTWQRFYVSEVASNSTLYPLIKGVTTGDLIYIWGAQLEAGSFPTSYIQTPATFTSRASTATYYDANGVIQTAGIDVARSNAYFPDSNGVMRPAGLLLEGSGTNLVTYSEDLTDASWVKGSSSVTGNAATAPDGTLTADKLVENTNTTSHVVSKLTTTTAGLHTFSVYLKKAERSFAMLYDLTNGVGAYFDLNTGQISTGGSGIPAAPTYSSQNVGNGWWRCSITSTATAAANTYRVYLASSSTIYSYTGDGTSGIYIWGAQLEASPYPTSYIPTAGSTVTRAADVSSSSTVTRAADVASITGSNFSSWYNQSEGTLFAAQRSSAGQDAYPTATFILCSSNPNAEYIGMEVTNDYNRFYVYGNGDSANNNNYDPVTPGTLTKNILSYELNNVGTCRNGGTVYVDNSVGIPITAIDRATIGHNLAYGYQKQQHISRLTYFPTRLPDAILQSLTT